MSDSDFVELVGYKAGTWQSAGTTATTLPAGRGRMTPGRRIFGYSSHTVIRMRRNEKG
ncbi:hypothetical protein ACFYXM_36725 [Streptomyces sp. NPDC002476]|uniref:hypothetical protein n=1 Tax=Streptomyces sp. NPDC002476 TaxID=3364648 RepID=UPI0036B3392E